MSNTNDEQAPYGEKREPLLSDELLGTICDAIPWPEASWDDYEAGAKKVRDFYENLISKGEVRVVKKVGVELVPNNYDCLLTCTGCRDGAPYYLLEEFDDMNFCPNCGGEIQK